MSEKKFEICTPDPRRAKGLHAGGCPWPQHCIKEGKCLYGVGETFKPLRPDHKDEQAG